ncbi:Laminin subunit beta-1, partial [Ophiophagus hannah]
MNVPLAFLETLKRLVGVVIPASVTTTLIPLILRLVTKGQACASSVCFTPKVKTAKSVNPATTDGLFNRIVEATITITIQVACECNSRGIQTLQCNRSTGQCICKEGVEGPHCDKCTRGYSGSFPDCAPCHQCFALWDIIVTELTNKTQRFLERAKLLKITGVSGPYQETLNSVEEKLNEIKNIIAHNPATEPLKNIGDLFEEAE